MSDRDARTTARTGAFSFSSTLMSFPSRVFTSNMFPSTRSIVPRIRFGGSCACKGPEAIAKIRAAPAARSKVFIPLTFRKKPCRPTAPVYGMLAAKNQRGGVRAFFPPQFFKFWRRLFFFRIAKAEIADEAPMHGYIEVAVQGLRIENGNPAHTDVFGSGGKPERVDGGYGGISNGFGHRPAPKPRALSGIGFDENSQVNGRVVEARELEFRISLRLFPLIGCERL